MRVGVRRLAEFTRLRIDVPVPLCRAGDPVRPVEPGVEPLRRVRRADLVEEHVGEFVLECLRVLRCREVAVALAPVAPATDQATDHLPDAPLRAEHGVAVLVEDRLAVLIVLRYSCFAEILRDDDVSRDLRPVFRYLGIGHLEDNGAVGVGDARRTPRPADGRVRILAGPRVEAWNPQASPLLTDVRPFLLHARPHNPFLGCEASSLAAHRMR
ncbi:hypothetical protein HRbin27_01862 [bacterium HR27]|nr:hypothetical protein HRbin27_01862 [bacterium HR27]